MNSKNLFLKLYTTEREEGILLTKKVLKLSTEGYTISQIAKECNISEDQVKKILE
ncbi:helix-turn-helix domain-containing protein [Clostridium magnum]|uniref:Helix-turn-helix domain of resolvase n=1 Tax=Clostridium magnum DSM 2767 TaxID=1121326 RepID=A0A162QF52_9CLOT|nr:helix-turn-helix domain-containing protein [Clostridium magnum]KZL88464.1 helix-turn-helix domain of resolvase [Clostridium magnum DSM 2767]SHI90469.1 Helix-turn-helix domain of resolvase [Clostridium magnum DSM 2767]